jgi:hypothetical protein
MLLRNQQFDAADFDQQTLDRFLQYVVWLGKIDKMMESYREAAMTPTLKSSCDWSEFYPGRLRQNRRMRQSSTASP